MAKDGLSGSTAAALRERVKELSCLYGIAQIAAQPEASQKQILQGVVELLPPAWQYPEIASARITLDGDSYAVPGFCDSSQRQRAGIVVSGKQRGAIVQGLQTGTVRMAKYDDTRSFGSGNPRGNSSH